MIRRLIFFLLAFIGLGAIAGGITLVAGPNGEIIKMDPAILSGSVFENFLIPGIVLLTIIGIDSLLAAGFVWIRSHLHPYVVVWQGVMLAIWIGVQVAITGYLHWLQPLCFAIGLALIVLGLIELSRMRKSRAQKSRPPGNLFFFLRGPGSRFFVIIAP